VSLDRLGWDERFAEAFASLGDPALLPGRVAVEHRSEYVLLVPAGEVRARLAGRLRHDASTLSELPAVGDWVAFRSTHEIGVIHAVLPRRSRFSRRMAGDQTGEQVVAANIDVVFLLTALGSDFNVRRLERYLTLAWESGAEPVIVLTKSDLILDASSSVADAEAVGFGVPVIVASSVTGAGVKEVRARVPAGRTGALLGSSGVGKSTLLNRLLGREHLRTAETREDGRGRHTTTHRELVPLPDGGLIIDTPGMRELQLWSDGSGLGDAFADISGLAAECRFDDCLHVAEPDCAVKAAVERGALDAQRLESFHKLQRELARLERLGDPLAAAERKRQDKSMMRLGRSHIRNKYR